MLTSQLPTITKTARHMTKKIVLGMIAILVLGFARQTLAENAPIFGTINGRTPFLEYPLRIGENETVEITLERQTGNLDTLIYLVGSNSVIVAENDDIDPTNSDSRIFFTRATAGEYTVVATRFGVLNGNTTGDFKLSINMRPPQDSESLLDYDVSEESLQSKGYPLQEVAPLAEWTILAYFGGDTNLEPGVMNDFNEFEIAGGSNEEVRIVALLDRHPEFSRGSGDWQTTRLFEVQADISADEGINFPPTIDSEPLADLGARDTSDGETLAEFLVWGVRHYPAKRYAILIGSHGGAWQGIVTDDTEGENILGLPELNTAFELARQEAGVERFDLLINDACSMSSVEYHSMLENLFSVSLASAEIVVDPALDLAFLTRQLQENPEIEIATLGSGLIDGYMTAVQNRSNQLDQDYLTYNLTDLTEHTPLVEAIEAFAAYVNTDPARYGALLGAARSNVYTYSAFLGISEQVDIGDFMRQITERTTDNTLRTMAQDVIDATIAPTLYAVASPRIADRITFYNIYFPSNASDFDSDYLQFSPLKAWGRMLRDYFITTSPRLWRVEDSPLTFHPPIAPSVKITRVYPYTASIASPPTVNVEIVGRRISEGAFTIDQLQEDGTVIRLAETNILTAVKDDNSVRFVNEWRSGVDRSVFQWTPFTLPVISDGQTQSNEFLRTQGELFALEGRYREPNDTLWNDVTILFEDTGNIVSVISTTRSGTLASVIIPTGSDFQAYRYTVLPNGNTKQQLGTFYVWGDEGLKWESKPTPTGNYNVGFVVYSFGGASGFDSVRVRVDNESAAPDIRGYTDVNLGLTFQTPSDWSPVVNFGNWLNTTSPDKDIAVNIYSFIADTNVYTIARDAEARYGLRRETELLTLEINGSPALYFDHTYRYIDGAEWRGRAVVFYRNTILGGQGVVYSIDTRMDSEVTPEELFRPFLNMLSFISADALLADDTSQWLYRLYNGFIPYPRLKNWDAYDERGWVFINPPFGYKGLTFAALEEFKARHPLDALTAIFKQYAYQARGVSLRTYTSQTHTWQALSYVRTQRTRNSLGRIIDVEVTGRIYVTQIYDTHYAWHFETPTDEATTTLRNIFEPMVDGFAPTVDFTSGGAQTAFIKAATLAQNTFCPNLSLNTLCYGGGSELDVITPEQTYLLQRAGERVGLNNVSELRVGIDAEGNINPYTVAILTLQANLPTRNTEEYLRLIAFGGATLTNNAVLDDSEMASVQVINDSAFRVNLRQNPDETSDVVGALSVDEVASAVAQSADGEWVRVQVPRNEAITGWISSRFVRATRPNEEIALLKIGDPDKPDFGVFQSVNATFEEDDNILKGVFVQTSITKEQLYIEINGTIYELGGGLNFLWLDGQTTLQNVGVVLDSEVFNVENTNRVPETSLVEAAQTSPARVPVTATFTPNSP